MAAGDVDVSIAAATTAAVDTAVTALYNASTDSWLACSIGNGQQIMIIRIKNA